MALKPPKAMEVTYKCIFGDEFSVSWGKQYNDLIFQGHF